MASGPAAEAAEAQFGGSASSSPLPDPHPGKLPPDVWRVSPDLAGVNGKLLYFSDETTGGHGLTFVGQDKDILGKSRKLYISITPASGDATFAATCGGEAFGG
jgi:hypothetical protein